MVEGARLAICIGSVKTLLQGLAQSRLSLTPLPQTAELASKCRAQRPAEARERDPISLGYAPGVADHDPKECTRAAWRAVRYLLRVSSLNGLEGRSEAKLAQAHLIVRPSLMSAMPAVPGEVGGVDFDHV